MINLASTLLLELEFSVTNTNNPPSEELTEKGHNYELTPCGSTVLCLDYRQNGIGSASCGPELLKKYKLDDEIIKFTIRILPELK